MCCQIDETRDQLRSATWRYTEETKEWIGATGTNVFYFMSSLPLQLPRQCLAPIPLTSLLLSSTIMRARRGFVGPKKQKEGVRGPLTI
jgi:hypothetical protein